MAYKTNATRITKTKPNSIASRVARTALMTEARPLIPQAHGIKFGAVAATYLSPSGNGMPILMARGAINTTEITIFTGSEKPMQR